MQEFLSKAIDGWYQFSMYGKFVVLIIVALIVLWVLGEQNKHRELMAYGTAMTLLCIVPISAAVLMFYQTRFYDYQWIWTLVPMTCLIAYAITVSVGKIWEDSIRESVTNKVWKKIMVSLGVTGLVFLCGSLGVEGPDRDTVRTKNRPAYEDAAKAIVHSVRAEGKQDIMAWAPKELQEQFRKNDGTVRLLYGRNMWDAALNAYSYDTYSTKQQECFWWMEYAEQTGQTATVLQKEGKIVELDFLSCVQSAAEQGVNVMVFPKNIAAEEIYEIAECLKCEVMNVEEYYVLITD